MALHAFVDESQGPPYRMAMILVESGRIATVRAAVRKWRHPGSARFHASRERDSIRAAALRSLGGLDVECIVVELDRYTRPQLRRRLVVAEVARVAIDLGVRRLTLEDAEPERSMDCAIVERAIGGIRGRRLDVIHLRASEEPILWAPDLVVWAYSRGGEWRERMPRVRRVAVP